MAKQGWRTTNDGEFQTEKPQNQTKKAHKP
jgi:hypothetical protein